MRQGALASGLALGELWANTSPAICGRLCWTLPWPP